MASTSLNPEMKANGFIMDKYLSKVGKMLEQKGYNALVLDTEDAAIVSSQAVKENRVYLTNNIKHFNKKVSMPCGCLHFRASPFSKSPHF